jgi:DNA (cytosine-5)-methyltransferase 1
MRRIARGLERFVIRSPAPFIVPLTHQGDRRAHGLDEPLPTVTAAHRGELALVAPYMIQTSYGERDGQAPRVLDLHRPLTTVVAGGQKHGLCAAFLAKHYGGNETPGSSLNRSIDTITAQDHHALVRAFLVKFYGTGTAVALDEPLDTVTTRDRFGLVMVDGEPYQIADIGMRMLQPHELFAAQGFPADYNIAPELNGKPLTKTAQIALAGNSVCPPVAAAIVGANARAA